MASIKKRGKTFYAQYYVNGKQKRVNLETESLQVAKDKLRAIESAQYRQEDIPLPTKSPIGDIVDKYITYLSGRTKPKNVQKVTTYLRATFGAICDSLEYKNKNIAQKATKRPSAGPSPKIEISHLEQLTTQVVSEFLSSIVRAKGVKPRTANHYRQTMVTLCNWAKREGGVRFPGGGNPAEPVKCYKVPKSEISFLRLRDIREQLEALNGDVSLQTMVATYIYAGLRREEELWLTLSDIEWDWGQHGAILVRGKAVDGADWTAKTQEDRIVPISRQLRGYLDRYMATVEPSGTWLFPAPEGGRWDPDNFSQLLREVNASKNLGWTCLDYRHTFGSQLAMKGESLYKVSKLMGNSPEICQKHYAALVPECLMASVDFPTETLGNDMAEAAGGDKAACADESPIATERPKLKLVVNNR